MPRPCTICHHPDRVLIEKAIVSGTPLRRIAQHCSVSATSLHRHKETHLSKLLAKAYAAEPPPDIPAPPPKPRDPAPLSHALEIAHHKQDLEAQEARQALDVVHQLRVINAASLEVLKKAREDGKHTILLRAVDRIVRQIELQAKLLGEIQEGPTVNVAIMPEWHCIRRLVADALQPYPQARVAVARALQDGGF